MIVECLIALGLAAYAIYRWSTATFGFFQDRGIPFSKPSPFLGSVSDMLLKKTTLFELFEKLYKEHDGKYYGVFDQRKPVYLIRDPDLIKHIMVKSFDHFSNHREIFQESDDLFGSSLVTMRNAKWKDMRSTLSPVFTGKKLREMFQLMNVVAHESLEYLKVTPGMDGENGVEMDMKDFCTRYTNDMIASVAFGLQVNSFADKDNQFYTTAKKLNTSSAWTNMKFMLIIYFPKLTKFFRLQLFSDAVTEYFMHLVLDAMKYRLENNIVRPDMVQMLMEAKGMLPTENPKPHTREWSDTEIVAQSFVFFLAGFDTVANLMCFIAHELMENPHVQERLYEEIESVSSNLNGQTLTFEALQNMKYLDMVVSEVLRKWPLSGVADRECTKDFVYESDGDRLEIKKGDLVWVPTIALHRDPKYFENPMEFNPERFSEENKRSISDYVYMPFGVGPRNCIANRFALLEAKAFIYYLVRDFKIEAGSKTKIPIQVTKGFQISAEGGFSLKLKQRVKA